MSAENIVSVREACYRAVVEEPGSTSGDVYADLRSRGIRTSLAVVSTALDRLAKRGRLVCQKMSSGHGTRACYRPFPQPEEVPHGKEEAPS